MTTSSPLRTLREKYNLEAQYVAYVIGIAYRNYQNYEKGAATPFKKLLLLADFFGVSLDWLAERTTDPYNLSLFLKLEDKLVSELQCYALISSINVRTDDGTIFVPHIYLDSTARKKSYSADQRADIITYYNIGKRRSLDASVGPQQALDGILPSSDEEIKIFKDLMVHELQGHADRPFISALLKQT